MDRALWKLMALRLKAAFRRLLHGMKKPKGILLTICGLGMFFLWIVPVMTMGVGARSGNPAAVGTFAPLTMFVLCILPLISSKPEVGLPFLPSEVDFLFAAPFPRRALLIYKITTLALSAIPITFFLSVFVVPHVALWLAGFAGMYLGLLFLQLFQINLVLMAGTVTQVAFARGRRLLALGLLVIFGLGIGYGYLNSQGASLFEALSTFLQSIAGKILLAPFRVYGRIMTAESAADCFGWLLTGLGMNLVMIGLIIKLDHNFLEASVAASQRLQNRLQRVRKGNIWTSTRSKTSNWQLPVLPHLWGIGPVFWRQATTMVRASKVLLLGIGVGLSVLFSWMILRGGGDDGIGIGSGVIVAASLFFLPQMLTFDFRGDVDRMDILKSLPVGPTALAIGQLSLPVVLASLIQVLIITGFAATGALEQPLLWLIATVAFAPVANVAVFGVENLIFLLMPYRIVTIGSGDVQAFGRQMGAAILKIFVLFVVAGVAALFGAIVYWLSRSQFVAFGVSWVTCTAVGAAILPVLGWAVRRFDPSRDTPM